MDQIKESKDSDSKVLHLSTRRSIEPVGELSEAHNITRWEEEYFRRIAEAQEPEVEETQNRISEIAVDEIAYSPFQTRDIVSNDELEELKCSIISRGILQPILVRRLEGENASESTFELVAGERRLRAARLAGLKKVPAIISSLDDQTSVEVSIIENAQRENLNPIEEAQAYLILSDRFRLSHADIAKTVGKNRATISNSLRLLQLEPEIIELLRTGELTAGHGRALLMVDSPELQLKLARLAVQKGLSVRTLEGLVSRLDFEEQEDEEPSEEEQKEEQSIRRLESKICSFLGIEKANLRSAEDGARRLTLQFDTEAAWKRFMAKIRE